mmetsp:Transcript_46276/g.118891  ORF Transcript_46276/g.118891 Transcript_46276/m.118891 type:complete len:275 (+) Transcript_46276:1110-1934(+)
MLLLFGDLLGLIPCSLRHRGRRRGPVRHLHLPEDLVEHAHVAQDLERHSQGRTRRRLFASGPQHLLAPRRKRRLHHQRAREGRPVQLRQLESPALRVALDHACLYVIIVGRILLREEAHALVARQDGAWHAKRGRDRQTWRGGLVSVERHDRAGTLDQFPMSGAERFVEVLTEKGDLRVAGVAQLCQRLRVALAGRPPSRVYHYDRDAPLQQGGCHESWVSTNINDTTSTSQQIEAPILDNPIDQDLSLKALVLAPLVAMGGLHPIGPLPLRPT